jgi:hypothetical protein
MHLVLGALVWDPQIRGALIVVTGLLVLPGSVYLLLATNTGMKLGFLLALAGLSGWLVILNILWLGGGGLGSIGYKGIAPGYRVQEIVTGDLVAHSALRAITGTPGKPSTQFPNGWTFLSASSSGLAGALPAAGTALIPPATGAKATSTYAPPFTTSQDYVEVSAWSKGGHDYLLNLFGYKVYWRIRHHGIYIKHQPHYVVVRVSPVLPTVTLAGAATTLPEADVTKPMVTVVLEGNPGSLRQPPMLSGLGALLVFLLTCENLHARDKAIARRKAEEQSGDSGPPGGGDRPKPAGELQPA